MNATKPNQQSEHDGPIVLAEQLLSALLDESDVYSDGKTTFVLCRVDPNMLPELELWGSEDEDIELDYDGEDDGEIDDEERAIEAAGNSTVSYGAPLADQQLSVLEFYARHKTKEEQAYWHGYATFHIDPRLQNPFSLNDERVLHISWNQGKTNASDGTWKTFEENTNA